MWVAHDKPAAWFKLGLIVLGLAIYWVLSRMPEQIHKSLLFQGDKRRELHVLRWTLGSLATLATVYFFLTNDWAQRIGKIPWLDFALSWFASWQSNLAGLRVNSNVAGGAIAALLPLQIAALFHDRKRSRVWLGICLVGLSGLGLLMSESRGAWIALLFVAAAWATHPRGSFHPLGPKPVWAAIIVAVLLIVIVLLVLTPLGAQLFEVQSSRLKVWRNSLDLAGDYAFTGVGLGNFTMAYSSYVLLVHVPHTFHAHNLFLDIWLEHGMLGLLAIIGLIVTVFWPNPGISRWRPAAIASIGVILLHGLVDDAFYGYGGYAAFLMFIPIALLARSEVQEQPGYNIRPVLITMAGLTAVLLMAMSLPAVRAIFKANVGAVLQTQVELTGYHWPESQYQDVVRLTAKERLAPAITWYRSALASDPTNATANRRLGQIELSFEQFDSARSHLLSAYASAPDHRATRQLLGECYAIAGETDQALALWRTIDLSEHQLDLREWWYAEYLHDQPRASMLAQAIAGLSTR